MFQNSQTPAQLARADFHSIGAQMAAARLAQIEADGMVTIATDGMTYLIEVDSHEPDFLGRVFYGDDLPVTDEDEAEHVRTVLRDERDARCEEFAEAEYYATREG